MPSSIRVVASVLAACAALLASGCGKKPVDPATLAPQPGLGAWALPAGPGSGQPDLVLAPDGRLLLSWLEQQQGRRTRLQYGEFANGRWQGPKTIAIGNSFVANWADTPHIAATAQGAMWVQWLQKNGEGYDVVLATSRNGGMNWSEPVRPHQDGSQTEHGFASLWPQGSDGLGLAWLDGRNTAPAKPNHDVAGAHHGEGATGLRNLAFDGAAQVGEDAEIDAMVCDCCQTDVAVTAKGPLLVYRDRTHQGIRDIVSTRHDGTFWRPAKPVQADGWKIDACPVNGPAVAANGNAVVAGWYTGANDKPTVKLAFSADAGDAFANAVVLDQGEAVQGRVDVAIDARNAYAVWVREDGTAQTLWLARFAPDLSKERERVQVAKLQGRGRGTGFPRLALRDGTAYIVWTDIADKVSQLHGAVFVPKP